MDPLIVCGAAVRSRVSPGNPWCGGQWF